MPKIQYLLLTMLISILVFFSTSFLTVLCYLKSPMTGPVEQKLLEIGFPLKYYEEFMIDCPNLNHGWNLNNLFIDMVLTFIIIGVIIYFITQKKILS